MLPSLSNEQCVNNKSLFGFFTKISIYTKIETRVSICLTRLCTLEMGKNQLSSQYCTFTLPQKGFGGGEGRMAKAFDLAAFGFP